MVMTLEPIICEHPFFRGLEERHVTLIVGCAKNVRFDEGELVFHEGEPANTFYVIREGRISIEFVVPGRPNANIQTIGKGEVLGWSWLFPPYRWHFNARAVVPVRALAFDGKCLREKCAQDTSLGYQLMSRTASILIERLQATRLQLLDLYGPHS